MTIGEINRYINAYISREERITKHRASYDYLLANTIVKGVSVVLSGGSFPTLYEVYPELFEKEAEQERINKSVANFMAFANSWNNRHKEK